MKKSLMLFIVLFLFVGCETKPYTKVYTKVDLKNISKIQVDCENKQFRKFAIDSLQDFDLQIDKNSDYHIELIYTYYKKGCNNPLASAESRNYNGFVRLSLFQKKKRLYICQKDFTGDIDEDLIEYLVEIMIDDLD